MITDVALLQSGIALSEDVRVLQLQVLEREGLLAKMTQLMAHYRELYDEAVACDGIVDGDGTAASNLAVSCRWCLSLLLRGWRVCCCEAFDVCACRNSRSFPTLQHGNHCPDPRQATARCGCIGHFRPISQAP